MARNTILASLLISSLIASSTSSALAQDGFARAKQIRLLPNQVDTRVSKATFSERITAIRIGKFGKGKARKDAYCLINKSVGSLSPTYKIRIVKVNKRRVKIRELQYYVFGYFTAKSKSERAALSALKINCSLQVTEFSSSSSSTSSEAASSSIAQSSAETSSQTSSQSLSAPSSQASSETSSPISSQASSQVSSGASSQLSSAASSASSSAASSEMSSSAACPTIGGIRTETDLRAMENNPSGNYLLCNDITLSPGFAPLFNESVRFAGVLDGANHVISGIDMRRPNDSGVALIMTTTPGSIIRNLIISNPQVEADLLASALVGVNAGTISNVHVNGGTIVSTRGWAGAVAGMSNSRPSECSTSGEILGFNTLGGLVGLLVPR